MTHSSIFHAGDWVEVRPKEEILRTLDENARLNELPFMPEMLEYCGKRFRVYKRAHKTCDPPNGMDGRRMTHAVHLEGVRCDGSKHGGCQARCLIFWKDEWLKPVSEPEPDDKPVRETNASPAFETVVCDEARVLSSAFDANQSGNPQEPTYVCQSTRMAQATSHIRWWELGQYFEDYTSGNVRISQLLSAFFVFIFEQAVTAGLGFGSALRWIYESVQRLRGGTPYPWRQGRITTGEKTPSAKLDVQPGDLVRIRSYEEILETINDESKNRGMSFDAEMVPYCGGTYRVLDRVTHIINEKTGKMQDMKNDCIMLEDVVCRACYSTHRRFCPRSIFPYWREIWLERVDSTETPQSETTSSTATA